MFEVVYSLKSDSVASANGLRSICKVGYFALDLFLVLAASSLGDCIKSPARKAWFTGQGSPYYVNAFNTNNLIVMFKAWFYDAIAKEQRTLRRLIPNHIHLVTYCIDTVLKFSK